ncbi:SNF2 family N-terminal domain-containing protein [Aspergillus lucknowensis]|uniref:SNF2 family N-terminal domain-containing protein n=1 Tax=Aspergillus lucknowensis TaxID=176173 RepID=A0ABR4L830_9EURO
MDFDASNDRPFKKRRFFVDDPSDAVPPATDSPIPTSSLDASIPTSSRVEVENGVDGRRVSFSEPQRPEWESDNRFSSHKSRPLQQDQDRLHGFDTATLVSITGEELSLDILLKIRDASGGDLERALNIYYDGSWKTSAGTGTCQTTLTSRERVTTLSTPSNGISEHAAVPKTEPAKRVGLAVPASKSQPPRRYVGAFGVSAWATRSGIGLVKHGDSVNIERARSQPLSTRGRNGKLKVNHKGDVLTRFTNSNGQEIGRLPRESAEWVSTLIDQNVCEFRGVCVFAPDRLRVNDTIYLQLWCYLRIEAFQPRILSVSVDDNRATTIFEDQENAEEKQLRLRQVALVKLFDEIGLQPSSLDDATKKQKKEGLLRAAEMAEQEARKNKAVTGNDSEEEEPAELEEDQLDALYKKAQSFDFNMPEAQPPSSFALELRKYQKQALHWMLAKEKDNESGREVSMHPLWEEYNWPLKDVDDKELPAVEGVEHFYVNPYSGELSLDFPAQEQHCLGGILADEMGLGKTIEMLSLVHSHRNVPPGQDLNGTAAGNLTRLPGSGVVPAPYTTLVVAPTSLLAQWESEALKASLPGSMKVLMYYGNEKSVNLRELCSTGNATAPNVIVTSYGVVLAEHRQQLSITASASWTPGNLFSVDFFRVILDEAHIIKNRRSKTARACYELKATHRWVLTGTPIVNRLEDLFSLVRFLKVEPWNNFSFWKTFITTPFESKDFVRALSVVQTVLEPLVLRRTKTMKTPEGEPLVPLPQRTVDIAEVELSDQEREIYNHIFTRAKQTFNTNVEAGTLLKSYSTIFAQLLRLRQTCCHPILTRNKTIVADEEDAAAAADLNNDLKDDMDLQDLIDRFTDTTENPNSGETGAQDPLMKFTAHALRQIQTESSGECPICSEEPMIDPAVTSCWHSACKKCLEDYIRHQTDKNVQPRCFSCRSPLSAQDIFEVIRHNSTPSSSTPVEQEAPSSSNTPAAGDLYSNSQPPPRISLRRINPLSPSAHTSAKIHALLRHLSRIPAGTKSVVFSQFTSFLDLISPQLTKAGINHVRLDGTMPQKARAEVLSQFNKIETFTQEELDEAEAEVTPTLTKGTTPVSLTPKPSTPIATPSPASASTSTSTSKPKQQPTTTTPTVLLISLRAGGVGLNLTAASNVFMMDPWWSFAIEAQAIDRVHRMGQTRDVSVTRFIVKDSIEGRMLRVQERKMGIAGSLGLMGGDGGEEEKRRERIAELRLLFE